MSDLVSFLVSRGSISFLAMDAAVRRWRREGGRLATSILETTEITPDGILDALCAYTGLPPARDALLANVDPDLAEMFNADRALRLGSMPLALDQRGLVLGVLTRLTPAALEELAEEFSSRIEQRIILEFRFFELLNRFYGHPIEGRYLMLSSRFPLAEAQHERYADDFFSTPPEAPPATPPVDRSTPARPLPPVTAPSDDALELASNTDENSPDFSLLRSARANVARIHESRLRRDLSSADNERAQRELLADDSFDAAFNIGAPIEDARRPRTTNLRQNLDFTPLPNAQGPITSPADPTDAVERDSDEHDRLPGIQPFLRGSEPNTLPRTLGTEPVGPSPRRSMGMEPIVPARHHQRSRAIDALSSFWDDAETGNDAASPIHALTREEFAKRDTTAEHTVQDASAPDHLPPLSAAAAIANSSDDSIARHLGFYGREAADHIDPNAFAASTLGQDWSAAQLSSFFAGVRTRDELLSAAFGYTKRFYKRRFFLRVSNDNKTYVVAMQGAEPTEVDLAKVSIPYADDSTIARLRAEMTYFAGQPQDVGLSTLYTRLRIERPQEMVVFPIRISDRAVMLLAADSGPNAFVDRSRLDDVFGVLSQLGLALQRLITSNLRAQRIAEERTPTGVIPAFRATQRDVTSPIEAVPAVAPDEASIPIIEKVRPDSITSPLDEHAVTNEPTAETQTVNEATAETQTVNAATSETETLDPGTTQSALTVDDANDATFDQAPVEVSNDNANGADDESADLGEDLTHTPIDSTPIAGSPIAAAPAATAKGADEADDDYIRSLLDFDNDKATVAVPAALAGALAELSSPLHANERKNTRERFSQRANKSNWGVAAVSSLLDIHREEDPETLSEPLTPPTIEPALTSNEPATPIEAPAPPSADESIDQAHALDEPATEKPAANEEPASVEEAATSDTGTPTDPFHNLFTEGAESASEKANAAASETSIFDTNDIDDLFGRVEDIEKSFADIFDAARGSLEQRANETRNVNAAAADKLRIDHEAVDQALFTDEASASAESRGANADDVTLDIDPISQIVESDDDDWMPSESRIALIPPPPAPLSPPAGSQAKTNTTPSPIVPAVRDIPEPPAAPAPIDGAKSTLIPTTSTERNFILKPDDEVKPSSARATATKPTPTPVAEARESVATPPIPRPTRSTGIHRSLPPRPSSLKDLPPPPPVPSFIANASAADDVAGGTERLFATDFTEPSSVPAGVPAGVPAATTEPASHSEASSDAIPVDAILANLQQSDADARTEEPATATEISSIIQLADIPEEQRRAATRATAVVSASIAAAVFGEEELPEDEFQRLLHVDPSELPSIVAGFPGRLVLNRHLPEQDARPVREHSRLLALVDARLDVWLAEIWACLERRDADARYYALRLLALVRNLELRYPLVEALFDEDRQVQRLALALVENHRTHIDFHLVLDAVRSSLHDDDAQKREAAAVAIERLRDTESIEALFALLDDSASTVREQARESLMRLTFNDFGPDRARWMQWFAMHGRELPVQWLVESMTALEPLRRELAARGLSQMPNLAVNYHPDMSEKSLRRARLAAERHFGIR